MTDYVAVLHDVLAFSATRSERTKADLVSILHEQNTLTGTLVEEPPDDRLGMLHVQEMFAATFSEKPPDDHLGVSVDTSPLPGFKAERTKTDRVSTALKKKT